MDEQSERMYEAYEAWKVTRNEVDGLMDDLRNGVPVLEETIVAIELMRKAWREFERVGASRLHLRK